MGALLNCGLLTFCLVAEAALLTAAFAFNKKYRDDYRNVLFEGSCSVATRWTPWTALVLNFIATLTMSSSNYVMQCLSSPSESELRQAHKNGRSLQLGASSPSNFTYLSCRKTTLWWLLGLSSIPVHLLLNSAFYSALQTNNYGIAVVTSDYDDESLWTGCNPDNSNYGDGLSLKLNYDYYWSNPWTLLVCSMVMEAHSYDKLENSKCIEQYSTRLLSQYSNVILVSSVSSTDRGGLAEYR